MEYLKYLIPNIIYAERICFRSVVIIRFYCYRARASYMQVRSEDLRVIAMGISSDENIIQAATYLWSIIIYA